MSKQANQYDKIFKENIEVVIPSLMLNILGITAVSLEEIPDDIQYTKERKPDFLKKVTDNKAHTFVLQIEFQVADERWFIEWLNTTLCWSVNTNSLLNSSSFI